MNEPSSTPRLLLTASEAAKVLSISQRTLFALTKSGQVVAVRIGRAVRYLMSDLEKYVASQRHLALE